MPATIELAGAETALLTRPGREHALRAALEDVADDYDWVLLDCPPSLGVLTVAALSAADSVMIPLQCETLSHRGVGQLLDTVHDVRRYTNKTLRVMGVLPTLFDSRPKHSRAVLETISATYGHRRDRAADPALHPVRRGSGGRALDLPHGTLQPRCAGLPPARGQPRPGLSAAPASASYVTSATPVTAAIGRIRAIDT